MTAGGAGGARRHPSPWKVVGRFGFFSMDRTTNDVMTNASQKS